MVPAAKNPRADGQVTGLAGELFVAGELLKRGLQTSITFGNAKAIDLFARNPDSGMTFTVQVKALRKPNYFPTNPTKVDSKHVYVFVLLNKPGQAVRYFVVRGTELVGKPEQFTKLFSDLKMPSIHSKTLTELGYEDRWEIFDQ